MFDKVSSSYNDLSDFASKVARRGLAMRRNPGNAVANPYLPKLKHQGDFNILSAPGRRAAVQAAALPSGVARQYGTADGSATGSQPGIRYFVPVVVVQLHPVPLAGPNRSIVAGVGPAKVRGVLFDQRKPVITIASVTKPPGG